MILFYSTLGDNITSSGTMNVSCQASSISGPYFLEPLYMVFSAEVPPRNGINMIYSFSDIPLCQWLKNGSLREYHAKHGVDVLNAAVLVAAHGAQ